MKYKVTNDTIKPGATTLIERVGHPISFVDANGRHHTLSQHSTGLFVDALTPGMMALRDEGLLRAEVVEDITTILKAHTLKKPAKVEKEERKAKAVEMGAEEAPQPEEGVNPDGEPNFVVKAKSSRRKNA